MPSSPANLVALPSALPDSTSAFPADDPQIATAIHRAQENLLRQQHPDGHWRGELVVDSTLCSDYVLFMHWLGEVDDAMQQLCVLPNFQRRLPQRERESYYR